MSVKLVTNKPITRTNNPRKQAEARILLDPDGEWKPVDNNNPAQMKAYRSIFGDAHSKHEVISNGRKQMIYEKQPIRKANESKPNIPVHFPFFVLMYLTICTDFFSTESSTEYVS